MEEHRIITLLNTHKESKALQLLYRYYPKVEKLVKGNSGTKQDAQDIFQDGLLIFCNKVQTPGFQLSSTPETFLYGICKNLWFNELKKMKNREAKNVVLDQDFNPTEEDNEEEQLQLATSILAQLSKKCQDILELFYFQKKSMQAIAAALSFTSAKVARNQKYKCIEKAKNQYLDQAHLLTSK